jgi:hypothetical protein
MHVIRVRNVHQAIPEGVRYLSLVGEPRETRVGKAIVAPGPVCTVYSRPWERVESWPVRDSNPFFHFFEALWMLAGRNDVEFPTRFNSKFAQFSDDGQIFNGAYGYRWRQKFGFDQLEDIIKTLKEKPADRRQVLSMWEPRDLWNKNTKDTPCNTHAYFSIDSDDLLNMTVCNRSNDMIWGAYGSNAVHFSMLQEYVAGKIGCGIGHYWQMSNNFHAYVEVFEKIKMLEDEAELNGSMTTHNNPYDKYKASQLVPMMPTPEDAIRFDLQLGMFLKEGKIVPGISNRFFRRVAGPMMKAYTAFSEKEDPHRFNNTLIELENCEAHDWKDACRAWIIRRGLADQKKKEEQSNG